MAFLNSIETVVNNFAIPVNFTALKIYQKKLKEFEINKYRIYNNLRVLSKNLRVD